MIDGSITSRNKRDKVVTKKTIEERDGARSKFPFSVRNDMRNEEVDRLCIGGNVMNWNTNFQINWTIAIC